MASEHPKVESVKLARLKPAEWNPRTISDSQFEKLCGAMQDDPDFLWLRPILAMGDGTIYAGNMRFQAAKHLGWQDVPAIVSDVAVERAKQRGIRDNNGFGEWQEDGLAELIYEVQAAGLGIDSLGFDNDRLSELLDSIGALGEPPEAPDAQMDRAEELRAIWKTERGQLWTLGKHRLLCGDSTVAEDVARVMSGEKAILMATDPPYGVDFAGAKYNPRAKEWAGIANDKLQGGDLEAFLALIFAAWLPSMDERAAFYFWTAAMAEGAAAAAAIRKAGLHIQSQIIWNKNCLVLGQADYHWKHENCWYAFWKGKKHRWLGERTKTTVWEVSKVANALYEHPMQKPTALYSIPMDHHTYPGEIVAEPFSGSGSQLIAAEQIDRVCYGIELDPKYVAVALERWSKLTGETPAVADGR